MDYKDKVEGATFFYARGLAKFFGLDEEEVMKRDAVRKWKMWYSMHVKDPRGTWRRAIERHERLIAKSKRRIREIREEIERLNKLIKEHERRIRKHELAIKQLQLMIERYEKLKSEEKEE